MVFVKILGAIDVASSISFLMLAFGMHIPLQYLLFCSGLLLVKGMFVIAGDVLSWVDFVSAVLLLLSLIVMPPMIFIWACAFLLLSKGLVSFI